MWAAFYAEQPISFKPLTLLIQQDFDMKDAFTAAHSDLVQNKIELSSSIKLLLVEAASVGVCADQIAEVGDMLESFNIRVNTLAKRLAALHDKG